MLAAWHTATLRLEQTHETLREEGRRLTGTTTVVRGDFEDPARPAEIVEKFVGLASGPVGRERALQVPRLVERIDTLKDLRELTDLLGPLR